MMPKLLTSCCLALHATHACRNLRVSIPDAAGLLSLLLCVEFQSTGAAVHGHVSFPDGTEPGDHILADEEKIAHDKEVSCALFEKTRPNTEEIAPGVCGGLMPPPRVEFFIVPTPAGSPVPR